MRIELVHFLPGRIRLRVPVKKKNQIPAKKIQNILMNLPGIIKYRVNPSTGSLLIYYQPARITHSLIIKSVIHAITLRVGRQQRVTDWHTKDYWDVVNEFKSDSAAGLALQERHARLATYGYNEFSVEKNTSILSHLTDPLKDFMGQLLLGIGLISFFTRQYYDAVAILGIIGLEAGLGVIQSLKAEKSMSTLKELATPFSKVLAEGNSTIISSAKIVPGDIIIINEGDIIPADCRLISAVNLMIDESTLTGESLAVAKKTAMCSQINIPVAERANMAYMSTRVIKGNARAVVVATGSVTEIGQLAQALNNANTSLTPLQQQLEQLSKKLAVGSLLLCGCVIGIGLIKGRPVMKMVRTGLTLAVGVIPEGLPTVVTIASAFGIRKMAEKHAIVRKLSAVETLGNATVICTDKTGTLTKGEMAVKTLYTGGCIRGAAEIINQPANETVSRILLAAALCNNAQFRFAEKQERTVSGDPTDVALIRFAIENGLTWQEIHENYCRQKELVFDSQRKMMTVVCTDPAGSVSVYTKGAVDEVMGRCKWVCEKDQITVLDAKAKQRILDNNTMMCKEALRVVALAYRPLEGSEHLDEELEQDLLFLGLVGLADPIKPGVPEAVKKCRKAGIKVVMITGDHPVTAHAVGKEVGLLQTGTLITGSEIDQLNDRELLHAAWKADIYARATPQHKLRIVKAFKELGCVVAMTGDGVNDAPAVREAHVGIAMGQKGTDVTREAAELTLADDNFTTIVHAIEEGQNIRGNIQKSLQYALSGNFGEVAAFLLTVTAGSAFPLAPSQIILVNFITESIPVIALGAGESKQGLTEPENNSYNTLIHHEMKQEIIKNSLITGLTTYGFFAGTMAAGGGLLKARTMALSNLVFRQMFNFLDSNPTNKFKLPSAGAFLGVLLSSVYIPALNRVFQTTPLKPRDLALLLTLSRLPGRVKD
ncbi:MAG: HAD-IC family P-type ATPase [Bacillota bacterium]|nr:HAD-IC family P-type ATPase [Bacillota bacterium]MDW7683499.1 HAD-IC family P-type ATPase [Bacillota bacterium]